MATDPTTGTSPGTPLLEVRDLKVSYHRGGMFSRKTTTAVDGVSLSLDAGATLGVVGQSGSGKSSLAKAIIGLEEPSEGSILIDGHEINSSASERLRRRTVQMVFQDSLSSLNPKRTIGSTLAEPLEINEIVPRGEVHHRVARLLRDVGLPDSAAEKRPSQLSGGQRQRVNIARALASEPRLIIADEPTSALDVSVRAQVLDLLLQLQAERGLSLLFISHDLHVIRHVSHTVMVMNHGSVVEAGSTSDIYERAQHPYTRQLLQATPSLGTALAGSSARGRSAFT